MFSKSILLYVLIFVNFNTFSQNNATVHLLFVGNSLTYTNDLPSLVKEHASEKGYKIKTKMIAFPNYGLEDHWNDGKIQELVKSNKFDYIIIQQGPSSQEYGRISLLEYGKKLKSLCNKNKTQLVFFMVWPSRAYYHTYNGVIKNYTNAAKDNDALLCPVGKVWKTHFDDTNDFSYYDYDGFHPSLEGSKIAAAVIVETLIQKRE